MVEIPLWYAVLLSVIFGSCIGSFYNVVIYRMPRDCPYSNPFFLPHLQKTYSSLS
jgi:leader peptidase (prepilin peptidase)/N-methyltransferase